MDKQALTPTATYTVSAHEGRYFVTDGDHTLGDFAAYDEALERAEELEAELDAADQIAVDAMLKAVNGWLESNRKTAKRAA